MASVTQRISQIKQPYGGYLQPKEFEKIQFEDEYELGEENIHATLVGLAVDYMTRFVMGTEKEEAFKISLIGAQIINDSKYAFKLLKKIKGFDSESIYNACKLVGYDVCFRASPMGYKDVRLIDADDTTIRNIKIMIKRSTEFFERYGPVVKDGFTFEGGYTNLINAGDGDFLTKDTLWDFKVSSLPPKSAHTLQLLIYYIMGQHSIYEEFDNIKKLGIYNPRLNCVFLKEIDQIPPETIETVSKEVIGYNGKNKTTFSSDELTISDVMRELQCTRYKVMKLYAEEDIPLKKINNKYYINRKDLYEWLLEREEEERKQARIVGIIMIVVFAVVVALIFYLEKNVFNSSATNILKTDNQNIFRRY